MESTNNREELMKALQDLGQTASTETALFHEAAAERWGLGITDVKTLTLLIQEGPAPAGIIASRLNLTTGAVTNVIDRLERKNFVYREHDKVDRRKVIVVVNMDELVKSEDVYSSIGEAFRQLQETYTTEELAFLVKYQQATITITREETQKLKSR